jgi:hypothetical protein
VGLCLVCILCFYPHPRAITLFPQHSPPVRTKLTATRMATQRDAENNPEYVGTRPVTDDRSNSGPLLQPRTPGTSKRTTRVCQSFFLFSDVGRESSWNSTQIAESHGRPSLCPSKQCVEVRVTGSFSTIPMPPWFLNILPSQSGC